MFALECPGVSGGGVGWRWLAAGLGALSVAVPAWYLLKEFAMTFITSTIVWPHINSREETQFYPSTENWIKDLLSMVLSMTSRPSFPLSQYLALGSHFLGRIKGDKYRFELQFLKWDLS